MNAGAQAMTTELETEAEKMACVPGIYFMKEAFGRTPRIARTGLQVYEIIGVYRDNDWDWNALREAFHWLSEEQLQTAIAYYRAYPEEVDAWLAEEDALVDEAMNDQPPSVRAFWRR